MRILKFSMPGCAPCAMASKLMKQAGINFEEIDGSTDEGYELAERYNVRNVPVVIALNDNDGIKVYKNLKEIKEGLDELKQMQQ